MNYCYILQICCALFLLITLISGRALNHKNSNQGDDSDSLINDDEALREFDADMFSDTYTERDLFDDLYEEREFHQRAIFSTTRPPHAIAPNTRQAIIDILQKALDQGWRPNLKHYIPATRFGRHRR